ncbi:putative RNA-directed DNA polymerase [Tanacetum coccineum]
MEKVLAVGSHTTHLIHPSDYPKQLYVNEVLTDNNFADWSQEMTNFLFAKNKIEFVDGTIKKPEKTSKDYMSWMRVDAMIKDLNKRFGKESTPRAYKLKQKIASTRQGGASVSTYFTQLRSIWDEAQSIYLFPRCSCNKCVCDVGKKINEHLEKECLYEFLMGLDAEFTVIRTQILATKPVPSLGTAYHMVSEDERQRAISNENINPHAVKEGIEHCTECNKDGHKREGCFKLIGYPEWWPEKKGEKTKVKAACVEIETSPIPGLTNEDYQYFLKHFSGTGNSKGTRPVANIAHKEDKEGEWIFDSGCTEYITYLSNILVNKKATHFEAPVIIPNGDSIPVKGKGDYVLPGGTKVNGVLYVPDFKCNLLSGLQKRNLIGAGRCRGGLYRMKIIHGRKAMATTVETWHRRLGHASKGKLAKVDFLKTSINDLGDFCDSCAKAKHTRLPFPSSFIKTSAPFELIHCDIWGGYRVPSYTKANYFLTIVDDFSRAFSTNHKAFLPAITNNDEPKYFKQVTQDAHWLEAMQREIKALEKNRTWTLEDLPKGKQAIDSKWVYKIKFKPNDEVERYKACLVAKGFTQKEGVDYHDTFAQVAKLVTVRTLLVVAVKRDWIIHQLDVNNAFLHGDLDEDVYMKIPQGFSKYGETRVCRLRKSLYGLKQASRNWYHKFTTFLFGLSFRHSKADHSLFIYQTASIIVVVLIYVDDIIITGNCLNKIQEIKKQLDKEFSVKDLGPLKYFLRIEVAKTGDGLVLSQRKYILDILKDSRKLGCKLSSFPIEQGLKLDKGENEPSIDASQYRHLIGRLLYLQATRPDITYSVNVLSQFVADPRNNHLEAANRILGYLKATPGQGILLSRAGDPVLIAYCDSDWLGCSFIRRSRTGYFLLLGETPIFWKTKKQSVVSRSSAKAEYRAMASTISEVI